MSTRGIIAKVGESENSFNGRYVHCDSMPTSMGSALWNLLHGHFKNDLKSMLTYLIDAPHAQCGWSAIVGKDFSLAPAYTWQQAIADGAKYEVYSQRADYRRPQCFAGRKGEEPYLFTEKDLKDTDCEWLFAFDPDNRKLFVRDLSYKEDVAVIDLDGEEPNWKQIECAEDLSRCGHMVWVHFPELKGSNLSTQTFLGNRPLDFRDAIGFVIGGKTYKATGSGGNSDYLRKVGLEAAKFPPDTWVSYVVAGNGRRMQFATAKITSEGYKPMPNVQWIYPATKNMPQQIVGA